MFEHDSVLKEEAVEGLAVKPNGIYVDCTVGGGGHSEKIAQQLETGKLFAFDQDLDALAAAKEKLDGYRDKIVFIHANFRLLKEELKKFNVDHVDGILFDLGVSSPQLDRGNRGFSYRYDARLDMRMDQTKELNAYDIINTWPYEKLVHIFFNYGEEKFSKQIARRIEQMREHKKIETTFELVEIIKEAIPAATRRTGGHPAKRIFQAIRIAVNDELQAFQSALDQSADILNVNGRLSVITFHSLEDRICKATFKQWSTRKDVPRGLPIIPEEFEPSFNQITRKPITASNEELENNRRSRSAKLRIVEKVRPFK